MIREGNYVSQFTEADAKIVAEKVFGRVENLTLTNSKCGKILQFDVGENVCRYEIRDFGLTTISPRMARHRCSATSLNLGKMYSAYMNFMKNATDEKGRLRFPDYEKDLTEMMSGLGI